MNFNSSFGWMCVCVCLPVLSSHDCVLTVFQIFYHLTIHLSKQINMSKLHSLKNHSFTLVKTAVFKFAVFCLTIYTCPKNRELSAGTKLRGFLDRYCACPKISYFSFDWECLQLCVCVCVCVRVMCVCVMYVCVLAYVCVRACVYVCV